MVVEWSLNSFLSGLETFGWYDVALPFVLVWVIVFAVLEKVEIFGEGKKSINMIISLVAAFLFIRNAALIEIMNRLLPKFSILLIVLVLFLALVGLFGAKAKWKGLPMLLVFIIAGVSIWWAVASSTYGYWVPFWARISPETRGPFIVTIIIVIIAILLWISGGEEGSGGRIKKTIDNLLTDLGAGE